MKLSKTLAPFKKDISVLRELELRMARVLSICQTNVFVSMLQSMGLETETFASSTGPCAGLA